MHYFWVWSPASNGRWGSALVTRRAIVKPTPIPGFEGWVVGGQTQTSTPSFAFSVHLPPEKGSYIKSAHTLLDRLHPIVDGASLILGGDFNLTVGLRRDFEKRQN